MAFGVQELLTDSCGGFSLVELRKLIRWFIDANQYDENGNLVVDPMFPDEWLDHCVNMTYLDMCQLIAQSFEGNFVEEQEIPVVPGTTEYDLPGSVFKIDRVLYKAGDTYWPLDYSMSSFDPEPRWAFLPTYWIRDFNKLVLNPSPASATTIKLRWYAMPGCIMGDKGRPNPNLLYVWHYTLAIKAAIRALTKSGDDSSDLQRESRESWMIFMKAVDKRSAGPKFVRPWFGGFANG